MHTMSDGTAPHLPHGCPAPDIRTIEARYRAYFEQAPDAIVIVDPRDATFIEFNDQACAQLGYTREEFGRLTIADIDAEQTDDEIRRVIVEVLNDGRADFDTVHRTKQGEWRTAHVTAQVIDAGGVRLYQCVWRDITDRVRAERDALRSLDACTHPLADEGPVAFEDLFDMEDIQRLQEEFARATGVASVITRPDGTPLTTPSRFCTLCQDVIRQTEAGRANCYRSDAALGRLHPEGPVVQRCMSGGLWDAGAGISVDGRPIANWLIGQVRDESQSEDTIRVYARDIGADEDAAAAAFREVPAMSREQFGHVAQVLFTLANQLSRVAYQNLRQERLIAELRRAEREQRVLQEQLSQAQKMESIGRLAGGVAHDFNNMLSVILGHGELALEHVAPDGPARPYLDEIKRAADRSAALVRQLLAFARRQPVSPRVLSLNDTVEGLLNMLRRLIGESIQLSWTPAPRLRQVRCDPTQVDQVLTNLCVNARDSINGIGQIAIRTGLVHVSADESRSRPEGAGPGDYVMLEVADTGSGMSADVLQHLFEPFFTTKERGRGTGLGLAMVYGIAKQNGGFVTVDSEVGRGTIFRLHIPALPSTHPEALLPAHAPVAPATGDETVLLVEDEPAILRVQRTALERLGYTVLAAGGASEAIATARRHEGRIDLLLTDVIMPEMNGLDLARHLQVGRPEMRALFMSGYTADVIASHGTGPDRLALLEKPFTSEQLAAKVREIMDRA
jgi:PAS domain S-box-containing protein